MEKLAQQWLRSGKLALFELVIMGKKGEEQKWKRSGLEIELRCVHT